MSTTSTKVTHEYFGRRTSEWCITGFLGECNVEPFRQKINCYLSSLENIANIEEGRRQKKAQQLLNNYRQA
ncbi:9167_t:CDS:2, partial [Funneliformis caledonium]